MKVLIAVDLQNDFIDGALGTPEASAMLPAALRRIREFDGPVLFTRDTHGPDYPQTREGRVLPVPHCIAGTDGWQIAPSLQPYATEIIDKPTFGSTALAQTLSAINQATPIGKVTLIGLCTDICVISNALLLKAAMPELPITIDPACCAGVTPEKHAAALEVMKSCQIGVE